MNASSFSTSRGHPLPLGASPRTDGANFSLLCRHGSKVSLVILPESGGSTPLAEFPLDPHKNRTGDHWHIRVHDLPDTFCFGWRVDGPAGARHRFNPGRILIDPTSMMISNGATWAGTCEVDPERTSRRSLYHNAPEYDWGDDAPPLTPHEDSIVYELHVRGFTCHPSSNVKHPGTFAGLIEKIPYLKWLGVTAVELLPIHEFDECDCPFVNPTTAEKLVNFWGYNSIAFAAPKAAYAAAAKEHGQLREFRDFVKAFHAAGLEVILDVVFNHTGEGDDRGRTFHFRGLDNELYYLLDDLGRYLNYSGCGNTVNCNHPIVRDLLMDCLRYWGGYMHVDGFRFDLASILGRDRRGNVMLEPPVIEMITEDGVLANSKLIAEPWDVSAYQVGSFPFGQRWCEWNGRYRDDIRRFWRGEPGFAGSVATRLAGSSDLYQANGRRPWNSVNFITCHDGFTLNDLVTYSAKHNFANGEQNRDGSNDNYSWNCGIEGETDNGVVLDLRRRQAKNMMVTLMLSQGVPMIMAGDEYLRTQKGNNNAWCQDNEISWLDWSLAESNKGFLRFVRETHLAATASSGPAAQKFPPGRIGRWQRPPRYLLARLRAGRTGFHQAFAFRRLYARRPSPRPRGRRRQRRVCGIECQSRTGNCLRARFTNWPSVATSDRHCAGIARGFPRRRKGADCRRRRGHRDGAVQHDRASDMKSVVAANILDRIGDTPMVQLNRVAAGLPVPIFGKCEFLNPGGSGKDRIAKAIIEDAEACGELKPGDTLIEATAGNTGVGLALVAANRGYRLVCVMPEKMSSDKRQALAALGAEIIITANAPPHDPKNFRNLARALADERGWFLTDQFASEANPRIHETTTGPEILAQSGGYVGAFVAGAGTGGTLTGVGRFLKRHCPDVQIVLADPIGSRLAHRVNAAHPDLDSAYQIEGIGGSEVPATLDLGVLDAAERISDEESFAMTGRLLREEGLLVGGSSGAAVAAAINVARRGDVAGPIVALLADSWDRYYSQPWFRDLSKH